MQSGIFRKNAYLSTEQTSLYNIAARNQVQTLQVETLLFKWGQSVSWRM